MRRSKNVNCACSARQMSKVDGAGWSCRWPSLGGCCSSASISRRIDRSMAHWLLVCAKVFPFEPHVSTTFAGFLATDSESVLVWFWFWFCFTVLGLVFGLWSSLAAVTAFSAQLPGLETDLCGYARLVGGSPLPIVNSYSRISMRERGFWPAVKKICKYFWSLQDNESKLKQNGTKIDLRLTL